MYKYLIINNTFSSAISSFEIPNRTSFSQCSMDLLELNQKNLYLVLMHFMLEETPRQFYWKLRPHCFHLKQMFHSKLYLYYFLATLICVLKKLVFRFLNLLYFLIHKMELRQDLWALTLLKILASKYLNYRMS